MPFPKLSPLQSRFAVSLGATILLALIYFSINRPSFAYAAELDSIIPPDHNHPIILDYVLKETEQNGKTWHEDDIEERQQENNLLRRAPEGVSSLANNAPQNMNVDPGVTQNWVFSKDQIEGPHGEEGTGLPTDATIVEDEEEDDDIENELRKRQSIPTVWITINTCLQPSSNATSEDIPPQLQLFYSNSSNIEKPGATTGGTQVNVIGGFGIIELESSEDVYIGVSAPNVSNFNGIWNYEIAASNDAPFHSWSNETDLLFVDGDNHAALLVTPDLMNSSGNGTIFDEWMSLNPAPYGMFAHDQKNQSILGVSRSYCGLLNNAKVAANIPNISNNNVGKMTSRGLDGLPKEQFYVSALQASSSYYGWLVRSGNSTTQGTGVIGGGGKVWTNMTFETKASDNCALLYNLTFCSEVAYAVPSNPEKYSPLDGVPDLAAVYDSYASSMYQYFNYSLQQIPCNTTATSQYSLARTCDDCAHAYKQWLCAVTIPRCEDWDNNATYLQPRNMAQNFPNNTAPSWIASPDASQQTLLNSVQANSSRNPQIIDEIIQPGPYKEVLPCIDLCYDLVRSCPASLGFGCPQGKYLDMSYGVRTSGDVMSCSYLGAAYLLSGGASVKNFIVDDMYRMGWMTLLVTLGILVL